MKQLFTIGHSTRSLEDFLSLLTGNHLHCLVDVRTVPYSRRVPWFNRENLAFVCQKNQIVYYHMPQLGGFRKPSRTSINTGWINSGFRGFADYMQTADFFRALKELNQLVNADKTVIVCAEALPWRCHRSLIADAEVIRSYHVKHILNRNSMLDHHLTAFAKIMPRTRPKKLYYPKAA